MNKTDKHSYPIPVQSALRKLGRDIRDARRRRRIQTALLAERSMMSRTTLHKIERGDPSVAFGHYATVLFSLGLLEPLKLVADIRHDSLGQVMDEENLPKRIRLPQEDGKE